MKKLLFLICLLLIAPISKESVQIKKNTDEIERIKQHLKTKKITVDGDIGCAELTATDDVNCVNVVATTDVQSGTFTYGSAITRYYTIGANDFHAFENVANTEIIISRTELLAQSGDASKAYAPLHLPHGAIITKFTVTWFRDDEAATGEIDIYRADFASAHSTLASADSNSSSGYHTVIDTTISNATIDNTGYTYGIEIILNPNDATIDVQLIGIIIEYTITVPLP